MAGSKSLEDSHMVRYESFLRVKYRGHHFPQAIVPQDLVQSKNACSGGGEAGVRTTEDRSYSTHQEEK